MSSAVFALLPWLVLLDKDLVDRPGCRSWRTMLFVVPKHSKGRRPKKASPWWLRSIGDKPARCESVGFRLVGCHAHFLFSLPTPLNQITTYETEHNAAGVSVNWRVSTRDARTKLHRFYPFPTNVDGVRVICHSVARNGLIFCHRSSGELWSRFALRSPCQFMLS